MPYAVTRMALDGVTVAAIGTGDLTKSIRLYEPGSLVDWGTITFDFEFDGAQAILTPGAAAANLLIDVNAAGVGSKFDADSYINSLSFDIPVDDVMTGTVVFRLTEALVQA
jgi:hypothetical protein